jgi:pheromone shutdown protein TraB
MSSETDAPVARPRHTDYSQEPDPLASSIETTIPAKKPAADLPADDFFTRTSYRPIFPTGSASDALAGRVEGVHVFGGLHRELRTINRLFDAIRRYRPDIIAVEACHEAIHQHQPERLDLEWPLEHEVEAASFAVQHTAGLSIAGIDVPAWKRPGESGNEKFVQADAEIFTEFDLIESPEELTRDAYYQLDRDLIREWREKTQARIPDLFSSVIQTRDDVMAGRLYELYHRDDVDTVVAVVGVKHLTGILDRLQAPNRIPDTRFECPKVYTYEPDEAKFCVFQ